MSNSWVCVDASIVVRLVAEPDEELARHLWRMWAAEGWQIAAPRLLRYEVTNALHQYQRSGSRSADQVHLALRTALALRIIFDNEPETHQRAMALAHRFRRPAAYEAHYLALAERLGAECWTADRRLANSVRSQLPWVHLVGE